MLWMTQYQILVMMSAKGRSPVFPDMFSSVSIYIYLLMLKRIVSRKGEGGKVQNPPVNLLERELTQIGMSLLYPGYIRNILVQYS